MPLGRCAIFATLAICASSIAADDLKYIQPDPMRGLSKAVVVGDLPLIQTTQFMPRDGKGELVDEDITAQAKQVLSNLKLSVPGATFDHLVKLSVYVASDELVPHVELVLASEFSGPRKPAVSFVTTKLPNEKYLVAMDAVVAAPDSKGRGVRLSQSETYRVGADATLAYMPPGTRIYIAGQAEKGESLAEATRLTLESLEKTLQFLGRSKQDIVQLKAFLSPMADWGLVESQISTFYGKRPCPPVSYVEWQAPLIEIELVAWGGDHNSGPVAEFLTPPNMPSSPVFSRVARTNSAPLIYTSGLYGSAKGDAGDETKDIFGQLEQLMKEAGSDFKHLIKATYYCATDESSKKLNEIRPSFYDPNRPPSASKAMVRGTGRPDHQLTLDMIAVPAWTDAIAEYGEPEFGHGVTAEESQQGWISLFDGKTTYGWRDAQIDQTGLFAGRSTVAFGPSKLIVEAAKPGTLKIGTETFEVTGTKTFELLKGVAPIELSDSIRVRSIRLMPLRLKPIFNGESLDGWKRIDRESVPEKSRPEWRVDGGTIRAFGGPGALEYSAEQFDDFVLQVEARGLVRHANGGVFVRAIPGDFINGYEAQIYNRAMHGDPSRPALYSTGAIDDRQSARRLVSRDGEFFTLTVIARGNHLATWVNGMQMTDWIDERPPRENPRQGLRTKAGVIQLQAHDRGTAVEFRSIRVVSLSDK